VAEPAADEFAGTDAVVTGEAPFDYSAESEAESRRSRDVTTDLPSQPSLRVPEDDVWEGGFSPKAMAGSFIVCAFASIACLTGAVIAFVRDPAWLGGVLLLAIPVLWLAQASRVVKRCWSVRYRLTDRRLFVQIGLFSCQKHQIELAQVEAVRIRQNMLDRVLDVGSIEILTRDRHIGRLLLEGVDNVDLVAEKIRSIGRRLRERQAVPVEGVGGGT
jgi:membrane protein YdbS with pleckstrin-like domain